MSLRDELKAYGAKGGKIGGKTKGKVKRRGDSSYYKALSAKAAKARKQK